MAAKLRPRVVLPRFVSTPDTWAAEARGRQLQRLVSRHALLERTKPAPIRERSKREVSKCEPAKNERSPFAVGLATVDVSIHEASEVA